MAAGVLRASSCDSASYAICSLCGASENLLLCARCKATWYCSKQHQRCHWRDHKKQCRQLGVASSSVRRVTVSDSHKWRDQYHIHTCDSAGVYNNSGLESLGHVAPHVWEDAPDATTCTIAGNSSDTALSLSDSNNDKNIDDIINRLVIDEEDSNGQMTPAGVNQRQQQQANEATDHRFDRKKRQTSGANRCHRPKINTCKCGEGTIDI